MSLPAPAAGTQIVITGAASGIGAELARQLARRGHDLALVDRQGELLDEVAAAVRSERGVDVETHVHDLSVERQRTALVKAVLGSERELVGLCNNAGIASIGPFHKLPYEREREIVAVNAVAVHHLTGALLPELVRRREGAILNTASLAANQPLPNLATYAATKAFVHSFSEALHTELRGSGVSVTSLCPGGTATGLLDTPGAGRAAELTPFLWGSAASVAAAGIEGMVKGRRSVVPGAGWRMIAAPVGRYVPRSLGLPVVRTVLARAQVLGNRVR